MTPPTPKSFWTLIGCFLVSGSPMIGPRSEGPPTPPLLKRRNPRENDPDEEEWFNEDEVTADAH